MNVIFSCILVVSAILLTLNSPDKLLTATMDATKSALTFSVTLFGVYSLWLSVMKVMEKLKVEKSLSKALTPLTKKLFPHEEESTYTALNYNLSANLLGMGGVATPMGIKATEKMRLKKNRVMLICINSAGLQLIPTTIIALRAGLNAKLDIVIPSLIVNLLTTVISVVLVKVLEK